MDSVAVEWRDVESFPGYRVSSDGQIMGRLGSILKPIKHGRGYRTVSPCLDGKNVCVLVHRLVAVAFHGPIPDGHEVNHIDGDKTNNAASNLEYVTRKGNMSHARRIGIWDNRGEKNGQAKATDAQIIRGAELAKTMTIAKAAEAAGCPEHSLSAALSGAKWKHLNLQPIYRPVVEREKHSPRTPIWKHEQIEKCISMRRQGSTLLEISRQTGIPEETVRRQCLKHGLPNLRRLIEAK